MQKKRCVTGFLTRKLVLAFILAAVPPMLIAGKVATELVNSTINNNVEHWLRNTTRYIMGSIEKSESQLRAAHTLLRTHFVRGDVSFSPEELRAFSDLDVDVILLRDAKGNVLMSSQPMREFAPMSLFPDANLKWVTMEDGSRTLAIVVSNDILAWDGSQKTLEVVNLSAIKLTETGEDELISIRVFLPTNEGFILAYASGDESLPDVPKETLNAVLSGSGEVFVPDWDWTDNLNTHLFLKGLSGKQGETVAVFAVSAHIRPHDRWLPSSQQLFWGIFVVGMLLASCTGYFLARKIVQPIKLLNEGVKNIASGNLGHRIVVLGSDEIAELSTGFNLMGRQLEIMQCEGVESAKQDRSRMLGEIALGFAHEIRNPLVVIKTSAELVHAKLPGEGKDSRLMGFVVEEVGRIDRLIKEFLAFANPEPVTFEFFSLHKLAKDILEISTAELDKHAIRYSLIVEATDCSVLGEQNQIRQVLLNLLLNALDAMPEGGKLRVRLYETRDKKSLCIEVADTGEGISKDVLPKIFQPFFSMKKDGLGLGLAKTLAIIEAHGGSITCSSEPGQGSVFTVCLNR